MVAARLGEQKMSEGQVLTLSILALRSFHPTKAVKSGSKDSTLWYCFAATPPACFKSLVVKTATHVLVVLELPFRIKTYPLSLCRIVSGDFG